MQRRVEDGTKDSRHIKQLKYYVRSRWLVGVFRQEYVNAVVTFSITHILENYFIKAIEDFFPCLHNFITTLGG